MRAFLAPDKREQIHIGGGFWEKLEAQRWMLIHWHCDQYWWSIHMWGMRRCGELHQDEASLAPLP